MQFRMCTLITSAMRTELFLSHWKIEAIASLKVTGTYFASENRHFLPLKRKPANLFQPSIFSFQGNLADSFKGEKSEQFFFKQLNPHLFWKERCGVGVNCFFGILNPSEVKSLKKKHVAFFHHFPSFFYMIWTFSVFGGNKHS